MALVATGALLGRGAEAAIQAGEPTRDQYVALGDSYSAGEGLDGYEAGTDEPGSDGVPANSCHRSINAYPRLLERNGGPALNKIAFAACSGAVIADVASQVKAVSTRTGVVSITIGGNDLGFAPMIKDCTYSTFEPAYWEKDGPTGRPGCAERNRARVGGRLDELSGPEGTLARLVRDLVSASMNRDGSADLDVYVGGYPLLVGTDRLDKKARCNVGNVYTNLGGAVPWEIPLYLDKIDVQWMRSVVESLNNEIQASVNAVNGFRGARLHYVDVATKFQGHGVCEKGAAWVNAVEWKTFSAFSDLPGLSPASFHPNLAGHRALAQVFSQSIKSTLGPQIATGDAAFVVGEQRAVDLATVDGRAGRWQVSGTLPPGLMRKGTTIGGTATTAGIYLIGLTFVDRQARTTTRTVELRVEPALDPDPDPSPTPTPSPQSWLSTTGLFGATIMQCPTVDVCFAFSQAGRMSRLVDGSWQAPQTSPQLANGNRHAVSCPSASRCVVAGYQGLFSTDDGGASWSRQVEGLFSLVSCVGTSSCIAVGGYPANRIYRLSGTTWSLGSSTGIRYLDDLECVSETFCAAVNTYGDRMTFDGTNWRNFFDPLRSYPLRTISCLSPTDCLASGEQVATWNGASWTTPRDFDPAADVSRATCSRGSCRAARGWDLLDRVTWTSWSVTATAPRPSDPVSRGIADLACPASNRCLVIYEGGDVAVWDGSAFTLVPGRFATSAPTEPSTP